jgi:hypothetical protein
MPAVLPAGRMHDEPGQQSASLLQTWHAMTHAVAAQTNGGTPPGFGTHGMLLQQSALEAHEPLAITHCAWEQRGTPTLS